MRSCGPFLEARHEGDVCLDGPVREEAAVLDDVSHAAAQQHWVPLRRGAAFEFNGARGGRDQAVDGLEESGFAGSAAAQENDGLAFVDLEVDLA